MGRSILQSIAKGLLARFVGYGALALGFWLLYRGFQIGNLVPGIPLGLGGGAIILLGMYLMVSVRQGNPSNQEDEIGDPIDRSNQSG